LGILLRAFKKIGKIYDKKPLNNPDGHKKYQELQLKYDWYPLNQEINPNA